MRSIALSLLLIISVTASNAVLAVEKFGLETDTFQLGQWAPKDLSYQSGMAKIKSIDQWFYGLQISDREKFLDAYTLNRNRLFLVTQEKRLAAELQPSLKQSAFGASEGNKSLAKEQSRQLAAIRQMSDALLDNPENLKKGLFNSLNDIAGALPYDFKGTGSNLGSSFSNSMSKSGSNGAFGQSFSKLGRGDVGSMLSGLQSMRFNRFLDDVDCKGESKCLAKLDKFRAENERRQKEDDDIVADLKRSALKQKRDGIIQQPFCKKMETDSGKLADAFDPKKNPKTAQFLTELKVPSIESNRRSNDLSSWYTEPTTQWDQSGSGATATCSGHAIASNVMAALYKEKLIKIRGISSPPEISPDQAYAMAKIQEYKKAGEYTKEPNPSHKGYCDSASYGVDPYEGMHSMVDAMSAFKTVPLCTKSQSQATKDMFRIDKFSAAEFGHNDKKPGFEFFKALIDSGNPPIVGIDSDSRVESAGWLKITSGGRFTHVINLVGYDEGVDPMTLCPMKYFIVRDSLGKQKIHYKVAADNLLGHLDGVYHASKVSDGGSTMPAADPAASRPTTR